MRIALAELAPAPARREENLRRVAAVVRAAHADLVAFPELFLSGYHIGDRLRPLALREGDPAWSELARLAREERTSLVVGAPLASAQRPGEVENAALVLRPDGSAERRGKRYLPTFGPFEEGLLFTPAGRSEPVTVPGVRLGIEVCYDVFFPEVTRELALAGADLLLNISASPTSSRRLFERLLPARAAENGLPVAYVNRVGVEDGLVFAGGSGLWDARGEAVDLASVEAPGLGEGERLVAADLDLAAAAHWRPFRPVLRDLAARPPTGGEAAFRSNASIKNGSPPP